MKKILILVIAVAVFVSCRKEKNNIPPPAGPEMIYSNLLNIEVKQDQSQLLDLNKDSNPDFMFITFHIGDPILKREKLQFLTLSTIGTYVLADPFNNTLVLNKGTAIKSAAPSGFGWFEVQNIILTEKITPETGNPFWEGAWKSSSNKYIPLQVKNNGIVYNGWIELTMDMANEKLILHKAAISKEAGKEVKAGY